MMVKQLGKDPFSPDLTKAQFDGTDGERALQTIVDFIHRDRIDAFERPQPPQGVPVLATDIAGSVFNNTRQIGNVAAASLDPQQVLVADFAVMPVALRREKSVKEAVAEMAAFANATLNSA
jgi:hypothetical protein